MTQNKKLSKVFYSITIGILGLFLAPLSDIPAESPIELKLIFFGGPLILYLIVFSVFWYKAWKVIQDEYARTTPGKAIGFFFIPLFDVYWVFQMIWGFSKDYNNYINRYEISANKLSERFFLFYCILEVLLPPLAFLTKPLWFLLYLINLIILIIMINDVCNGINTITEGPVQKKSIAVPIEIKKWNWGAFFLNIIWGLCNKTYIALLCFIPLVNIVMMFVLGSKGNEWAWNNKQWSSIEHFLSVQKKWNLWGIILGIPFSFLIIFTEGSALAPFIYAIF